VVWVVGDATIDGSETGTSFRQALHFKDVCGFRLHDTMIYHRKSPFPGNVRYFQAFEYMYVFSRGKPNTFNPLKQLKSAKSFGKDPASYTYRDKNGDVKNTDQSAQKRLANADKIKSRDRDNVWYYGTGYMVSSKDAISFDHPATFPEQLAKDHILSWSNPGDLVYDPMSGSGTVPKQAILLDRDWIASEMSEEYVRLANERLEPVKAQTRLF